MTKITDRIKIEVEMTAREALRSMIVLGRTNGHGDGAVWKALRDNLDPQRLFTSIGTAANDHIGIIDYKSIENEMASIFFGLYDAKAKSNKLAEIELLERENLEIASRISKLKLEIGE